MWTSRQQMQAKGAGTWPSFAVDYLIVAGGGGGGGSQTNASSGSGAGAGGLLTANQ